MNDINFLPQAIVEEQARLQRIIREAMLVLFVIVALAAWHMSSLGRVSILEHELETLQNEMKANGNKDRELTRLQIEYATLAKNAKTQRLLTIPVETMDIIKVIGAVMPKDVAISDFGLRTPPPLAPASDARHQKVQIHMVGISPDDVSVADFVDELTKYPMFDNVKMLYSRASRAGEGDRREFRIEMDVPLNRSYRQASTQKEVGHEG
jgi:Tfp pilus assembly protein PilN